MYEKKEKKEMYERKEKVKKCIEGKRKRRNV